MYKKSVAATIASFWIFVPLSALADGLINNGHVNGPHTLVSLTEAQIRALDHGSHQITLTTSQRQALQKLPGANTVKQLLIYPRSSTSCTCELADVAVRTDPRSIEVADCLLGRDMIKEYKDQAIWVERRDEQQKAEKTDLLAAHPTREAVLNGQGLEQHDASSGKAIEYFKMALQVNPNYKWARSNLASSYFGLGSTAMYGKANFGEAVRYLELALKTADPTDTLFIDSITRDLKIAKAHQKAPVASTKIVPPVR